MDVGNGVWYAAGLILLLLAIQILAVPLELAFRFALNSAVGAVAIWAINAIGAPIGWQLGLNPASALTVGLLGVPGVVALSVTRLLLG